MNVKKIGLIGPGRLGLCVALLLEKKGFEITAVETDLPYLEQLRNSSLKSPEPGVDQFLATQDQISFTDDVAKCLTDEHQILMLYVPTPESKAGYDHSILLEVLEQIMAHGKREVSVPLIIGCTTLPGFHQPLVEKLREFNYHLVYSPAFIAQGSIIKNLQHPDILLIGSENEQAATSARNTFQRIAVNNPPVHCMDLLSAEITKLATNCFLTAKIAFANAIGDLAVKTGGDQEAILSAIGSDSRIGPKYLKYGFGFGGPCFPRDNRALNYFARQAEYELKISEATEKANEQHTEFQLNEYFTSHSPSEEIYFDHVTYKPGTDILEESQQLKIALALAQKGRKVKVGGSPATLKKLREVYADLFIYPNKSD